MFTRLLAQLEPISRGPRHVLGNLGGIEIANGAIGFLFATTGPLAVILSVGTGAGLSQPQLASWIFGVFFINGAISILMTWLYRIPLCFFWTIPGTVLVGPALQHMTFPEVVGAFYATSLLLLVLGISGIARRAMSWLPMPIVMGMVAGVFLQFGLNIIVAMQTDILICAPMLAVFVALTALPALGRIMPPIIGTLLIGIALTLALGRFDFGTFHGLSLITPLPPGATFSLSAMIELVVPLAITILIVQNGQGIAILTAACHPPPVSSITLACGIGGVLSAAVGAVGTCLAGPTNAILTSSGEASRQYTAAFVTGVLAMAFGLASPTFTSLMLAAPKALIMMLGGLAMLRVLQGAFMQSFKGPFALGALVSFLVTIGDVKLLNIGAPFWGIVAGALTSLLLERADFASTRSAS